MVRLLNYVINSESTGQVVGSLVGGSTALCNIFQNSVVNSIAEVASTVIITTIGGICGWLGAKLIKLFWNYCSNLRKKG